MKSNFNKIYLLSLSDDLTQKIAKKLSDVLGMMFCDAEELLQYELIDIDGLKKFSTKAYLDESEQKVVNHIATFEDVVVKVGYDLFVRNKQTIKNSGLVIFLDFPKQNVKNVANNLAFEQHKKDLQQNCDFCISLQTTDQKKVCDKIIGIIGSVL